MFVDIVLILHATSSGAFNNFKEIDIYEDCIVIYYIYVRRPYEILFEILG